jgi:hypothetical protein
MKKISTLLFLAIILLFSSVSMAQDNDWVGVWELKLKTEDSDFNGILTIENLNGSLVGNISINGNDRVIEHFNDSDDELILGFKMEGSDNLYFPSTLLYIDWNTLSGSWKEENVLYELTGKRIINMDYYVGDWKLYISNPPTEEIQFRVYGILNIGSEADGSVVQLTTTEKGEVLMASGYSKDFDGPLTLSFRPEGAAEFYINLQPKNDKVVEGSWQEEQQMESFTITGERLGKESDDWDGGQLQSNPWDGQFNLDFKNIDDKETNFVATLNVDYVNGKLEGYIIYFYQDDKREEVVIEHFNDSDTELILGFKVDGSDALFFPLTLHIEDDGSISGSWEDKEESYTIEGFRIAPI